MEKLFVSYEIAKELKELGFNEPCFMYWDYDMEMKYKHLLNKYPVKNDMFLDLVCAPLTQQIIDWFDERGIDIEKPKKCALGYLPHVYKDEYCIWHGDYFETKHEATKEAIKQAIKIYKANK